jgi:uncharacterized protein (TIGR02145 family)
MCIAIPTCFGDLDSDGNRGTEDLLLFLAVYNTQCPLVFGCMDSAAINYNPTADYDDGSCEYGVSEFTCGDPMNYHGYDYATVQIGEQCWFAENLRTELYQNGDSIVGNLTQEEWQSIGLPNGFTAAMAIYGENGPCYGGTAGFDACTPSLSLEQFGRLYSGFAVLDERGLCPIGFHVPSDSDFSELEAFIGVPVDSLEYEGHRGNTANSLKSTYGWFEDLNGSDAQGFKALPSDMRACWGNYGSAGQYARFWTSEIGTYLNDTSINIWSRTIYWNNHGVYRGAISECQGLSVRCLKDAE